MKRFLELNGRVKPLHPTRTRRGVSSMGLVRGQYESTTMAVTAQMALVLNSSVDKTRSKAEKGDLGTLATVHLG